MRDICGKILFSATNLMSFMGCAHQTVLDLVRLRGGGPEPREDAALLQKQTVEQMRLISSLCALLCWPKGTA